MTEFFQTIMGRAFYDGTMPRIATALERIATALEHAARPEQAAVLLAGSWPWCSSCRSYHHPDNPTCLAFGARCPECQFARGHANTCSQGRD